MAVNSLNSINMISPVTLNPVNNKDKAAGFEESQSVRFSDFLNDALNKANNFQLESEMLGEAFAAGATDNIHQVMIATEKAEIALQFTMQIRNKILDAYNEIMRIQI